MTNPPSKRTMTIAEFKQRLAEMPSIKKRPRAKAKKPKPQTLATLEKRGGKIVVTLPYPCAYLSPNYAGHWRPKAKARAEARELAKATVQGAKIGKVKVASYQIHFAFPDLARRDLDNATGRCKSYLDGIADAIGQDDSEWGMEAPTREVDKGNPRVVITLKKEGAQ